MYGNARGTAAGVAPHAHVVVYKVCGLLGCGGGDILAAYDAAIEDGVDVLSLSLGGESSPFYDDPVALGAFAAIKKRNLDPSILDSVTYQITWAASLKKLLGKSRVHHFPYPHAFKKGSGIFNDGGAAIKKIPTSHKKGIATCWL